MKGIKTHFTLPNGYKVEKTPTGYRRYSKEFPYAYTETDKTLAQLIEDASPMRRNPFTQDIFINPLNHFKRYKSTGLLRDKSNDKKKMSKQTAGYTLTPNKDKVKKKLGGCKNCIYYNNYTCAIVDGQILPTAGCKYFKKQ